MQSFEILVWCQWGAGGRSTTFRCQIDVVSIFIAKGLCS